ncbi:MAG: class I SAM-dependent methyltransferase, partial [Clostridia bacterium]
MKINTEWRDYEVIATGNGDKIERWGKYVLIRPDPQIIWELKNPLESYKNVSARYLRSNAGGGNWEYYASMPDEWTVGWRDLRFAVKLMGFKHTGLFPEQAVNWSQMMEMIGNAKRDINVLNLFGYTGGATVACLKAGASVCHVDSAKNMVERCKQNCELSGLKEAKVRYIVDDCKKFIKREINRGRKYDAIIMDPPSYGRGTNGEIWKLEDDLFSFVKMTTELLSEDPLFMLINSYTTGL